MSETDELGAIVKKAHKIFNKKMTYEVMSLVESQGTDAVRKLLSEHGIKDPTMKNQYLKYLKEIDILLANRLKKRRFKRIRFDGYASLEFAARNYDICQVENISLAGMLVEGSFQEKIGDHCIVNLFPRKMKVCSKFLAAAKIVWKNTTHIGVEFTSMPTKSYMFLQATLLYEAEDPLAIGFEFPEDSPFEINDPKNRSS